MMHIAGGTRRQNKEKYPRSCTKWEPKEVKYLREYWATQSVDEISAALQRTPQAVYNKAEALGISKAPFVDPVTLKVSTFKPVDAVPGPRVIQKPETLDGPEDLVAWFCREAYLEGHVVEIPVLGALFQREAG